LKGISISLIMLNILKSKEEGNYVLHSTLRKAVIVIYMIINTLRTGDSDLRFYVTTVQDG